MRWEKDSPRHGWFGGKGRGHWPKNARGLRNLEKADKDFPPEPPEGMQPATLMLGHGDPSWTSDLLNCTIIHLCWGAKCVATCHSCHRKLTPSPTVLAPQETLRKYWFPFQFGFSGHKLGRTNRGGEREKAVGGKQRRAGENGAMTPEPTVRASRKPWCRNSGMSLHSWPKTGIAPFLLSQHLCSSRGGVFWTAVMTEWMDCFP